MVTRKPASTPTPWLETRATVTSCRYQFARLNTFTLGIPTTKNFVIAFDYQAHGRRYSDEFQSATAIAQNEQLPLLYNPLAPEQNSLSSTPSGKSRKTPLFAIGVAGSVILSLLWLIVLRGCG